MRISEGSVPSPDTDPQPNVYGLQEPWGLPLRFWGLVILTGIGTGLATGD
jgi:hypothetical protein